jgi:hypothetical protein
MNMIDVVQAAITLVTEAGCRCTNCTCKDCAC